MPQFNYQGRKAGQLITGSLVAENSNQAANQLIVDGVIPLKITESQAKQKFNWHGFLQSKPSSDELTIFCRQLYSLSKAGVPINLAIQRIAEITSNDQLKTALQNVSKSILLGASLSTSMQLYPKIFSPLLIALVSTGEANGRLDQAFLQAAKHYELESSSRKRIKSALRYPSLVILIALIAVFIINTFVVPKFSVLYSSFHADLPLPTRILIGFSNFTTHYWWLLLLIIILIIVVTGYLFRQKKFRLFYDRYQLKLPIIGSILERAIMASFARSLAMLLQTGVPLVQAINLVANVVDNDYAKTKILAIRGMIEHGENLAQAAKQVHFFSPLILQMLSVGEETGNIDQMLFEASDFYEQEVDFEIKRLTDRIEPLLLIIVGGVVLLLALGVFLPMWNMVYIVH